MQGPPDQLLCDPADNGGFLVSGVCELPDAVIGLPYQGHLVTSHKAGGALSVVSGSLPPGLSLPATFTGSGDTVGGTPADPGVEPGCTFTVQGTGDQGQPLYQAYSIMVDPNEPLAINASGGSNLGPGTVGQAYRAELLPQRRGRALHLVPGLRPAPARPHPADLRRPARRQQRARRDTDHGRHLHLHHAADRLPRPAGNPAIHPHHQPVEPSDAPVPGTT